MDEVIIDTIEKIFQILARGDCERCGRLGNLVFCYGPNDELLAAICDDCAKEYIDSGIDEL